MKQKTPMQELIEIIKQRINDDNAIPYMYNERILELAESMIDKEKKIIETAFWEGRIKPLSGKQYYNETFNTKETCTCKSAQFTREVTEDFEPMCGRCGRPI